jgi:hypothetical protein
MQQNNPSTPAKRVITDYFHTSKPGLVRKTQPVFPEQPEDVMVGLLNGPSRARKAVSEGYKTKTSLPSYRGLTIGSIDPREFLASREYRPVESARSKRRFDDANEKDDPIRQNEPKLFFMSHSAQPNEDFGESDFLRPKHEVMGDD